MTALCEMRLVVVRAIFFTWGARLRIVIKRLHRSLCEIRLVRTELLEVDALVVVKRFKVVLRKSIPMKIHQLILHIRKSKG